MQETQNIIKEAKKNKAEGDMHFLGSENANQKNAKKMQKYARKSNYEGFQVKFGQGGP